MTSSPRRALVTGGSGDIGSAIATALAQQGCEVIVHAHANIARAQAIAEGIQATGGKASAIGKLMWSASV